MTRERGCSLPLRSIRFSASRSALCGIVRRWRCRPACAARALEGGVGLRRAGCRARSSSRLLACRSCWAASARCCAGCAVFRGSSGRLPDRSACACCAPGRSVARWSARLTSGSPAASSGKGDARHARGHSQDRPMVVVSVAVAGRLIPDRVLASRVGSDGASLAGRTGRRGVVSTRPRRRSTIRVLRCAGSVPERLRLEFLIGVQDAIDGELKFNAWGDLTRLASRLTQDGRRVGARCGAEPDSDAWGADAASADPVVGRAGARSIPRGSSPATCGAWGCCAATAPARSST